MYEVRIYDGSGSLKEVVSVKTLNRRLDRQINSPSLYKKNRKKLKSPSKSPKTRAKAH